MANLAGFNAAEVEPNDFGTIPPGDYDAVISASEFKQTKDGQGQYLNLEIQILSGQYQNRKLFEKLNLVNKNDTAVQIAKGTLSSICRALGVLTPNDSSELHNKPLRISVGTRKRTDNDELQNTVKAFKPRQAGPVQQASIVTTEATAYKKPW